MRNSSVTQMAKLALQKILRLAPILLQIFKNWIQRLSAIFWDMIVIFFNNPIHFVGSDGHIASLFQGSKALLEKSKLVKPVNGLKMYPEGLTITPHVIKSA